MPWWLYQQQKAGKMNFARGFPAQESGDVVRFHRIARILLSLKHFAQVSRFSLGFSRSGLC
jgi:hypothetical protein